MLLKITEKCSLGCSHCMNDAKATGKHMTMETLKDVLSFVEKTDTWSSIVATGGEPTEHPQFVEFIETIIEFLNSIGMVKVLTITTNGFWILEYQEEAMRIVSLGNKFTKVFFQVSTDRRYYPKRIDVTKRIWREEGFILCDDCVEQIYPQGRAKGKYESNSKASRCFNVRAISKQMEFPTLRDIVATLASRGKFCTPSIRIDGGISLGESDLCPKCCSIYNSDVEIIKAIRQFKCDGCKEINDKLPMMYKMFL